MLPYITAPWILWVLVYKPTYNILQTGVPVLLACLTLSLLRFEPRVCHENDACKIVEVCLSICNEYQESYSMW